MVTIDCIVCSKEFYSNQLDANGVCKSCSPDPDDSFVYGFYDDDFRDSPYDEFEDWEGEDWEDDEW